MALQRGQARPSTVPHRPQSRLPTGFSVPHCAQFSSASLELYGADDLSVGTMLKASNSASLVDTRDERPVKN